MRHLQVYVVVVVGSDMQPFGVWPCSSQDAVVVAAADAAAVAAPAVS